LIQKVDQELTRRHIGRSHRGSEGDAGGLDEGLGQTAVDRQDADHLGLRGQREGDWQRNDLRDQGSQEGVGVDDLDDQLDHPIGRWVDDLQVREGDGVHLRGDGARGTRHLKLNQVDRKADRGVADIDCPKGGVQTKKRYKS